MECYGAGNAPVRDGRIEKVIAKAHSQGVVIVITSQCNEGGVSLDSYATGSALARAGAIGGLDMTAEACMTKLMYLLDQGLSQAEVERLMGVNLRGELTYREY